MAERVFFHVGVPKTGTTYLQRILWHNADRLRADGVLLPAEGHRDHRWGSLVIREDPKLRRRSDRATGAWDRIVADVRDWSGTAVISHEFYGAATPEQAAGALAALGSAEVHLVVTARNPLATLTAAWQETVKYGSTTPLDEFAVDVSESPHDIWDWRTLDAAEVLARWGGLVPPDRVHVVPVSMARGPREDLWHRFASLFLDDPSAYELPDVHANPSMGLVQTQLLQRVAPHVEYPSAYARSTWLRTYLGESVLVPLGNERFWPSPGRIEECRRRGDRSVDLIRDAGYHVVGDLESLRVPAEPGDRRTPAEVSDGEVADVAAAVVGTLLKDLERTSRELAAEKRTSSRLRARIERSAVIPAPVPVRSVAARLRRVRAALRRGH